MNKEIASGTRLRRLIDLSQGLLQLKEEGKDCGDIRQRIEEAIWETADEMIDEDLKKRREVTLYEQRNIKSGV
jgi:hypothetical protein